MLFLVSLAYFIAWDMFGTLIGMYLDSIVQYCAQVLVIILLILAINKKYIQGAYKTLFMACCGCIARRQKRSSVNDLDDAMQDYERFWE